MARARSGSILNSDVMSESEEEEMRARVTSIDTIMTSMTANNDDGDDDDDNNDDDDDDGDDDECHDDDEHHHDDNVE